jgi:zinc transporter 9
MNSQWIKQIYMQSLRINHRYSPAWAGVFNRSFSMQSPVVNPILHVKRSTVSPPEWRSAVKQLRRVVKDAETSQARHNVLKESKKVVGLAIISNGFLFAGKMYAAVQSGSSSMFSEALHSLADMLNESLLMLGIFRSLKEPDISHPYGFFSERYAWSLVSGVGVLFLGGGVSLYHGVVGLVNLSPLGDLTYAAIALGTSLLFEGVTITYAYKQLSKGAREANVPVIKYLKKGADPTTTQVFLEDCASITGITIAASCLTLSHYFSMPIFDSIGSIAIGCLLSIVASFLINRNVAGLVATSMPHKRQMEIISILENDPVVLSVHDVKTTSLGPDFARFKAEICFNGEEVTRRYIARNPSSLSDVSKIKTPSDLEACLCIHGGKIISTLGSEIDRLERKVALHRPEVKHIDLEVL